MKKILCLLVAVLFVAFLTGCEDSLSSRDEAAFATSQLPDYESIVSVTSVENALSRWVTIYSSGLQKKESHSVYDYSRIHFVLYSEKSKDIKKDGPVTCQNKLAVWDGSRPTKRIF